MSIKQFSCVHFILCQRHICYIPVADFILRLNVTQQQRTSNICSFTVPQHTTQKQQ